MKAVLIDHDDSFTFNLRSWLSPLFTKVQVLHHREVNFKTRFENVDLVVLSPGPQTPVDYPHIQDFLSGNGKLQKIFGVCLGLQSFAINQGSIVEAYSPPQHGKTSKLKVLDTKWKSLHQLEVARYHSLKCKLNIEDFTILATSEDDLFPMIAESKNYKWLGVQYHPESFLTISPQKHLDLLKEWLIS